MIVSNYPTRVTKRETTLILGAFESIHYGHVKLIEVARTFKLPVCVMLIENVAALPKHGKVVYQSLNLRLEQLANLGVDFAIVINFTDALRQTPGRVFLQKLIDLTMAKHLVVGADFGLGFNRDFNAVMMRDELPSTVIVEPQKFQDMKLSTSILRELVEVGDVHVVAKLSPFNFSFETSLLLDKQFVLNTLMPQRGVYSSWIIVNQVKYWAAVRIGFGKCFWIAPQLEISAVASAKIELVKLVRVITREAQDFWQVDDEAKAHAFLIASAHK